MALQRWAAKGERRSGKGTENKIMLQETGSGHMFAVEGAFLEGPQNGMDKRHKCGVRKRLPTPARGAPQDHKGALRSTQSVRPQSAHRNLGS